MKKHIVCFGDSNTHGFCGDPADSADHGVRFNEEERWTCLLQKKLGDEYLVLEEGLSGRTSVFDDPITEGLCGLQMITPVLMTHEPVSLLIIMLGTNDVKERFGCTAELISAGLERLIKKAKNTECWSGGKPDILLICPPVIKDGMETAVFGNVMGKGCIEKSKELPKYLPAVAKRCGVRYLDAAACEFNEADFMHLTGKGHRELAELIYSSIKGTV